ncbi:MAG: aldehyde dehydrogenase family protein [Leptospiraceae bacterium]|nr:aldehyde dehydrogenase family protein [Leptospiraceae bacterium]MCP5501497.1 aldehyde dehydrogenase family protein [Leptospiraceae bacterium]
MLQVINPATEEVISELKTDTEESIQEKFKKAKKAQILWEQKPYKERKKTIEQFKQLLETQIEELSKTLSEEVGKPLRQARNEILATRGRIDFFLEHTEKLMNEESVYRDENIEERITYEALGVIANISAWNYPYFVGSNVFIPALLTGNAVLYKPSEYASMSGLKIAELLLESGVPDDIFTPIIGAKNVGATLLQKKLDGVFFTGSYATGLKIAESSPVFARLQMELGGKDPVYVTDDVDVKNSAISLADGAFYNTGQSCCSVERIYVHESIFEEFIVNFVSEVKSFKVGNPLEEDTYIGPLARKEQLDFLDKQIKDARSKGAKLLLGGKKIEGIGYYYEPTIFVEVTHEMLLMKEESFGPIIGIQKVQDDEKAINLMNDTEYGLTAGVYCRNEARAKSILKGIKTGTAYWNCCDRVSPRLPWSGRKNSGVGMTLSHLGIRAFLNARGWHLRKS